MNPAGRAELKTAIDARRRALCELPKRTSATDREYWRRMKKIQRKREARRELAR